MIVAIMQPYLLPYIGYFQLLYKADTFVVYDDVSYIKNGWINRNNFIVEGKSNYFTVPIEDISSHRLIKDTQIDKVKYTFWKKKFYKTIYYNYKDAPYFKQVQDLVEQIFDIEPGSISDLAKLSLEKTKDYLEIDTKIVDSSTVYNNAHLKGKERVIDICLKEKADVYINPIGGQELYDKDNFKDNGLELFFIKTLPVEYKQMGDEFLPNLSILDVLFFNPVDRVQGFLDQFKLI